MIDQGRNFCLDLMKTCLTNWIYADAKDLLQRETGYDRPKTAHTMIGLKRLENTQFCVEDVLRNNIPGDLVEAGMWRGGAAIFMQAILKAHGIKNRIVWAADSFEGLPEPNVEKYPQDKWSEFHSDKELKIPLKTVKDNFKRYGLLDGQVRFLKGWFHDTLPQAPIEKLAVIKLDGDMYESTMEGLVNLYPKLSPGGYVIIDDYLSIQNCHQAVDDYRKSHDIKDKIIPIDWTGVYWQRSQ